MEKLLLVGASFLFCHLLTDDKLFLALKID
jgi:hypothetical protein